jgi:GNAT superfamily N-acetyltransferase
VFNLDINVRIAKLEDVTGITRIHCSDVKKWYRVANGEKIEASYEELNILERWAHGGPWMSIETCAIQINYLLLNNQFPLIAEMDGNIVGELELYIGEEGGILGKNAYIDILEVHQEYRGIGVGRSLVNKAEEIAQDHNCETIAVWPAKEAINFYEKVGFKDTAYKIEVIELNLNEVKPKSIKMDITIGKSRDNYLRLKDLILVTRRISTSYTLWLKQKFNFSIERDRFIEIHGYIDSPEAVFRIKSTWESKEIGILDLWIVNQSDIPIILREIVEIAKKEGFQKLWLYVDELVFKNYIKVLPYKLLGKELLLFKKLNQ